MMLSDYDYEVIIIGFIFVSFVMLIIINISILFSIKKFMRAFLVCCASMIANDSYQSFVEMAKINGISLEE